MKRLFQTIRTNFKRRHLIQLLVMTALFLIGARVCYVNEIVPRKEDAYTIDPVDENDDTDIYLLEEGETITQEFIYSNNQMIATGIMLYCDSDTDDNEGQLTLRLYDVETGELMGETVKDVSEIEDMDLTDYDIEYLNVGMSTILEGMNGKTLRLELTVDELGKDTDLYIYADPYKKSNGYAQAVVTGAEDPEISILVRGYCYLYNFWEFYYRVFAILIYLMMFLGYMMIFVLHTGLEKVFLVAGFTFAIVYNFLLPPVSTPDEMNHYATAYYYSNALLGIEEPINTTEYLDNECIYVRETDLEALAVLQTTPTLKEMAYIHWNLLRSPSSTELVEFNKSKESDNWILYIPGTLGITLGRLLNMNGITTLYLGRFFCVLLYLLLFYLAIKIIPIGKAAVFVFAICPMVIQQCCSYSYDAMPIGMLVLFMAYLFKLLYGGEMLQRKQIIALAVMLFLLAPCKGGVYMPFCFLTLLIPAEQFGGKKQKKKIMLLLTAVMVVSFALNTLTYLLQVLHIIEPKTATQSYSESLDPYTVKQVLTQPIYMIYVTINTVLMYADYYFQGMFSGPLGWLNISINPFWAYTLFALMFLGISRVDGDEVHVKKNQKVWFVICFVLLFAMSAGSMLISWTTQGNTTIRGIQGRYFTPAFLFLLFCFRGKFITLKRNIDNRIAFLGLTMGVVIVNNILSSIQSVQS